MVSRVRYRLGRATSLILDATWVVLWITAAWMVHPALGCAVGGGFAALLATVVDREPPRDDTEE
jgi:ABC-type protease/lipase transport system fused ATPase/permease subunit